MIDLILFAGRVLLVVLLYIFLFSVMRTGIGLVRGQRKDGAIWSVDVEKGVKSLRGLHVDILGPVVIGRSPSSDIVIDEPYVSASHARFTSRDPLWCLKTLVPQTELWLMVTSSNSLLRFATQTKSRSAM